MVISSLKQQALHESSILSILARHFPFVSNLWRRSQPKSTNTHVEDEIENVHLPKVSSSSEPGEMEDIVAVMERFDHSEEAQTEWSNDNNNDSRLNVFPFKLFHPEVSCALNLFNFCYSGIYNSMSGQSEAELFDPRTEPSNFHNQITEGSSINSLLIVAVGLPTSAVGKSCQYFYLAIMVKMHYLGTPSFQRGPLDGWNLGPGYQTAQEWARERAADPGSTSTLDNLSIFCLPVGVRPLEELKDRTTVFNVSKLLEPKNGDDVKALPLFRDFTSTASTLLKGRTADGQKKQGGLSSRAASMLVIFK